MPSNSTDQIAARIALLFSELTGVSAGELDRDSTFVELGFDSLLLTRASAELKRAFGVKVNFKQLFEEAPTINAIADYIGERTAAAMPETAPALPRESSGASKATTTPLITRSPPYVQSQELDDSLLNLFRRQLDVIHHQLQLIHINDEAPRETPRVEASGSLTIDPQPDITAPDAAVKHGPWKPISTGDPTSDPRVQQYLDQFVERYVAKTRRSKELAEAQKPILADPRAVSYFRRFWKEMVYQIAMVRSKGSKLWDVDGNEYVDLMSSFGAALFGHSPEFVKSAASKQIESGFQLAVNTPLAEQLARRLCALLEVDRVNFLNTGSEAVAAAVRLARTVTGRSQIATFKGDYHGISDELVVRGVGADASVRTVPVAPGIPDSQVGQVRILDYDSEDLAEQLEQLAPDLAAVIVEPLQSDNPERDISDQLRLVRDITRKHGTALIFDEVITGFRVHKRGAQGLLGIDADLIALGKVLSGGFPMSAVCGTREFMSAFDGGEWQFGDDSFPEQPVTFFGGTFVRHPVSMAVALATVGQIESLTDADYRELNDRTRAFADRVNAMFEELRAPLRLSSAASLVMLKFLEPDPIHQIYHFLLRHKGVYLTDRAGFINFTTTDADLDFVFSVMRDSVAELQHAGIFRDASVEHQYTLSSAQYEIWAAQHLSEEGEAAYNMATCLQFTGNLQVDKLEEAINRLLERHEALRTIVSKDVPLATVLRTSLFRFTLSVVRQATLKHGNSLRATTKRIEHSIRINHCADFGCWPWMKLDTAS